MTKTSFDYCCVGPVRASHCHNVPMFFYGPNVSLLSTVRFYCCHLPLLTTFFLPNTMLKWQHFQQCPMSFARNIQLNCSFVLSRSNYFLCFRNAHWPKLLELAPDTFLYVAQKHRFFVHSHCSWQRWKSLIGHECWLSAPNLAPSSWLSLAN